MNTNDFDLTKIHLAELEGKTENYVDPVFVGALKSLLSKNIICKTCKIVDMDQESVANQNNNSTSVAVITIPHYNYIRLSESNLKIFEGLSRKHPETFVDRWTETKTDNYQYIIAVDITKEDSIDSISQNLLKACEPFEIQDLGRGIAEEEDIKFKENSHLETLFPEFDWGGHYELVDRRKVWIPNQEHNITSEEIRERILQTIPISENRVLDENNQLWDKYYYEKHKKFIQQKSEIEIAIDE